MRRNAWEVGIDPTSTHVTYPTCTRSGRNQSWILLQHNAPMGWNWYLALQHAKVWPEATTQESHKKQAQQELARQQAQ